MDRIKRRSAFGWLNLLSGLLFIALGIALFIAPQWALSGMVVLLGLTAILSGIAELSLHAKLRRYSEGQALSPLITGIIGVVAGVLILLNPITGKWILNIAFSLWFIARCVSRIVAFDLLRRLTGAGIAMFMLCLNTLGLLLSVVMLFNQALFTMSLGILIGLDLVLLGLSNVVEAFSSVGAADVDLVQ